MSVTISRPHLFTIFWMGLIVAVVAPLYFFEPSRAVLVDFAVYYEAASRLTASQSLYQQSYLIRVADGRLLTLYYFYPPFLAQWLSPLTSLSFAQAQIAWSFLSLVSLFAAGWCLAYIFNELRPGSLSKEVSLCLSCTLVFCFEPTYWGIKEGQVNAIILALIASHIVLLLKQRDHAAGAVLAIAALLKMSPAVLLLAPLVLFRWKVVGSFLLTIVVSFGLLATTTPLAVYQDFFLPFGPLLAGTLERHYFFNFALDKAVLQLLGLDHLATARWGMKIVLFSLPVILTLLMRPRSPSAQSTLTLYGALCSCMILIAPTLWGHHLVWALVPLCVLAGMPVSSGEDRLRHSTLVLGLFVLISQVLLVQLHSCRAVFPGLCTPGAHSTSSADGSSRWLLNLTALLPSMLLIALVVLLWRWGPGAKTKVQGALNQRT